MASSIQTISGGGGSPTQPRMVLDIDDAVDAAGGGLARFQLFATVALSWTSGLGGLHSMLWTFTGMNPKTRHPCRLGVEEDGHTIISDWGLTCSKEYQAVLLNAAFFVGYMFGSVLLGWLSDAHGRRKSLGIAMAAVQLSMIICGTASSPLIFAAGRLLGGVGIGGVGLVGYVWNTELVGRKRAIVCLASHIAFVVGVVLLSCTAWRLQHWREQCWALFFMGLPVFPLAYILPESPVWLSNLQRTEEAKSVIQYIARSNGFESVDLTNCERETAPVPETKIGKENPMILFKAPLQLRQLVMCGAFFGIYLCYYALATNEFGSNVYSLAVLGAFAEVPAYFVIYWYVDVPTIGRKLLTLGGFTLGGLVTMMCHILTPKSYEIAALALIGRFAAAGSCAVVYMWGSELFPTGVRSVALGVQCMTGRLGAVAAPFVFAYSDAPLLVCGLPPAIAALMCLNIPETAGRPLPNRLEDILAEDVERKPLLSFLMQKKTLHDSVA